MIYIWIVDISFNGYKVDYRSYSLGNRIIDRVCQNWKLTHETRCSYDYDDERLGPFNDDDDNGDDGIEEEEDLGRKSRHRSSSLLSSVEYLCHTSSDVDINIDCLCPFYSIIKPIA